jgi:para-aminobenzoate synthetase/4-amino-4-deoxychorismate lyase
MLDHYNNMHRMRDPELESLMGFLSEKQEFVFLDTSRPDVENSHSFLFLDPEERLVCRDGDNLERYLETLQNRLSSGFYLAGWVAYEFGATLEGRISPAGERKNQVRDLVLADLAVFRRPCVFNHVTGESDFPVSRSQLSDSGYAIENLRANMLKEDFVNALHRVREYIAAGDIYQVNYTMKLLFDFKGSAELLYLLLRKNQSVAYGAYIRNGAEITQSFSPELFFRKSGDEITTRPMKGTAPRGRMTEEEKANSAILYECSKNRSENVMIVDLLRNDLARLMHGHGQSEVFVDSLFDIESYESLLQMTSTIKAKSSGEVMRTLKLTEIFRALFPSGSITGAPKIRTMQIIDELETDNRGVYTGAIGYFGPDGSAIFNVPIRTVRIRDGKGEMGVGAGITYGSVPEEEWEESLLKGSFLTNANENFLLLETVLWTPADGYWLLEEHLDRMAKAAAFFKYAFDRDQIHAGLHEAEAGFSSGCHRVRLTLEKDGRMDVSALPCPPPQMTCLPRQVDMAVDGDGLQEIDFSEQPVDTTGPWRFHKTTRRSLYDTEYERAREAGKFDRIFCNMAGEVTEGCITNIFIYKDGLYYTSPVSCGLLPGIMRGRLLAETACPILEKPLTRADVEGADAVFVCNSVRGVVRVNCSGHSSGQSPSEPLSHPVPD